MKPRCRTAEPIWARSLRRRLAVTRAALVWERLVAASWPVLAIIALFVALSLLGLWPLLSRWAHLALEAGFAVALGIAIIDAGRRFRLPHGEEPARRLEQANGLKHQPLVTLADQPAGTLDPASQAMWDAHQARARRSVRALRPVWPRPNLIARDPFGLRQAVFLLLLAGIVVAGREPVQRLAQGFELPESTGQDIGADIQAWITPPSYTGAPTRFLTQRRADGTLIDPAGRDTIWVPEGSILSARLGGSGRPTLRARSATGERRSLEFTQPAPGSYALSYTLTADQTLSVEQNGTVARWPVRVIPDRPPVIGLSADPGRTERSALAIPYLAEDDYGVTSARVEMRRSDPKVAEKSPLSLEIPLPGGSPRHVQETAYFDLTAHPWAGMPVSLWLTARDARGQTAATKPITLTLPEREFHDPLARAIVEQRKSLAADPGAMPHVAGTLDALTFRGDRFFRDKVLFLGLRTVYWRLRHAKAGQVPDGTSDMLWSLALRAEDGELPLAERDLRGAEQQLKDALKPDAGPKDFGALSKRLQQALDRFIQELAKKAERDARNGEAPAPPRDPADTNARSQDLHDLIDRAGKLGQLGQRDAARELLSQLEAMIQNMRAGGTGKSEADRKRDNALRSLSKLMERQQDLLDRSFRADQGNPRQGERSAGDGQSSQSRSDSGDQASQTAPEAGGQTPGNMDGGGPGQGKGPQGGTPSAEGQQGEPDSTGQQGKPAPGGRGQASAQENLRRQLGDVMNDLGDATGTIPGALGRAERAMRDAREALDHGAPGQALDPQRQAIDQMQQGADMLSRQMRENAASGIAGGGSNGLGTDRDPLGRPMPASGPDYGLGQHLPDGPQIEQARRILDEIERRASERGRPQQELDYLDRLLRRF